MTQLSKRSLRERRAPKPHESENEEQDPWGNTKPPQVKELTPSQQLFATAKIFARFLANINKGYKDKIELGRKKEQESIKEPLPVRQRKRKTMDGEIQGARRERETGEGRQDSMKKSKQGENSHKGNNPPSENSHLKPEAIINKYKALNHESASRMLSIAGAISKPKPPPPPPFTMDTTAPPPPFRNGFFPQSSSNAHHSPASFFPISKQKQEKISALSAQLNIPKPTITENKIFKRSAFHVAIAYHIYLNKLREKGSVGNEIDPTFYARRLKQGMNKN